MNLDEVTARLFIPTEEEPFRSIGLEVVDRGYSDKILMCRLPSEIEEKLSESESNYRMAWHDQLALQKVEEEKKEVERHLAEANAEIVRLKEDIEYRKRMHDWLQQDYLKAIS